MSEDSDKSSNSINKSKIKIEETISKQGACKSIDILVQCLQQKEIPPIEFKLMKYLIYEKKNLKKKVGRTTLFDPVFVKL